MGEGEGAPITAADLADVTQLLASSKSITDLTGLEHCTNLGELHLDNNEISDISPLTGLTHLTKLYLTNNAISDISALAELNELQELYLKGNELNSAAYAIHIPTLESNGTVVQYDPASLITIPDDNLRAVVEAALDKSPGEPITDTELANLTQLGASGRSIADLTGLEHCTNLERLGLEHNNISDISALASLTNLKSLYLTNNSISDTSALAGLNELQELFSGATT